MIPHQQGLLSSPHSQLREVESDPCHIELARSSPSVSQIRNSQDTPMTAKRVRRKARLDLEKKLTIQSQRKILASLIKIMLSQEKFSCSKEVTIDFFTLESLLTLNAEKLHSSRVMNAALNTAENLFHLKTLIAELKKVESEKLALKSKTQSKKFDGSNESALIKLKINNSKIAIYNAIIDVTRSGYDYHWLLHILNSKVQVLPKNIDRKQFCINRKNRLALESMKKQEARYQSKLQELNRQNINEQEILRTLRDFLFRYKTISLIKELFPDLKEPEMLQIIRSNLECQVTTIATASEQPFAQYDNEQPSSSNEVNHTATFQPRMEIANTPLNHISKIKMLQKNRKTNTEVFWKAFDQALSDAELKTKFEEFLFSDWDIDRDYNQRLISISACALRNKDLNKQYQVLSLRIFHRQMQKSAGELFRYILNVKKFNKLLATAKGENWSDLQKKLDYTFDNLQTDLISTIRSYHQQYINRKKDGVIFTWQDIQKLQNQRDSLRTNANKIKAEIVKTLPKRLDYVSHVLHILSTHKTIDAQTILFLAQHIPENDENQISQLTSTSSICAKRPNEPLSHFSTQSCGTPPSKRKATEVSVATTSNFLQYPLSAAPAPPINQFNEQTFSAFNTLKDSRIQHDLLTKNTIAEYNEQPAFAIQFAPKPPAFDAISLPNNDEKEQASGLRFFAAQPQASTLDSVPSFSFEEGFSQNMNSQNMNNQNIENDRYMDLELDFDLSLLDDPHPFDQR